MVEFNAAPSPCGVTGAALYFFESSGAVDNPFLALAAWAFALEVEEFFGHSLTLCPTPPQNMQRLLVNQWAHSLEVSLPSFLSLLERLGFLFCLDEPDKLGLGLLLDEEEADLLSEGWFLDADNAELADLFDFCSVDLLLDFLDSQEILDWCSQQHAPICWINWCIPERVEGFLIQETSSLIQFRSPLYSWC